MIILLRNGQQLGSTMIGVSERYTKPLYAYGDQLFPANEKLVATLHHAYEQASTWLVEQQNP